MASDIVALEYHVHLSFGVFYVCRKANPMFHTVSNFLFHFLLRTWSLESPRQAARAFALSSSSWASLRNPVTVHANWMQPTVSFMDSTFDNKSSLLSSLTVSIFVLGYVCGPLLLAPLSEIHGRRFVLTGANVFFCVWQIGAALSPALSAMIVFRFLAGIGGSGCLTIGGGVIADLFHADRRGLASAIYTLGPLFGPVIGPICGGFISQRVGWRVRFTVPELPASLAGHPNHEHS